MSADASYLMRSRPDGLQLRSELSCLTGPLPLLFCCFASESTQRYHVRASAPVKLGQTPHCHSISTTDNRPPARATPSPRGRSVGNRTRVTTGFVFLAAKAILGPCATLMNEFRPVSAPKVRA
eukprot:scaffold20742_cov125-Isochrysis_galbana.AAC.6